MSADALTRVCDRHGIPVPCASCRQPLLVRLPFVRPYDSPILKALSEPHHVVPMPNDWRCVACGLSGPQRDDRSIVSVR